MGIKIVFFDLDGTLVDNRTEQVPLSTIQSIKKLHDQGIHVVLATGRSYFFAQTVGNLLGIRNFINFSGAYIRIEGKELYKDPISKETIEGFVNRCNLKGDHVSAFGIEHTYSNGLAGRIALPILKKIDCHDMPEYFPENETEYISMCLFLDSGKIEDYVQISDEIQFYHWGADVPQAYNIEKKGNSKAKAVEKILEYYNLTSDEAMAFGDGGNDIEMLQTVRIGVAMGNARDSLKEKADFITKAVDVDGIEYALKEFNLLG